MSNGVPNALIQDLLSSGLAPEDILARPISNAERAATLSPASIEGYVIPYFNMYGKIQAFYRVKLFEHDPKYKQPKDTPNHVYFPRNFLNTQKGKPYVIITEGEKKAACAVKLGFPACALGGVDSWRNKIITLPKEAALSADQGRVKARIVGTTPTEDFEAPIATGMQDLIDYVLANNLQIIICYDSDRTQGVKGDVQRAAAMLGYELRFRGVPFVHIRQLILPQITQSDFQSEKVGIDDFLAHKDTKAPEAFQSLITDCLKARSAFPRHPAIRDYINRRLQRAKLSRKEIQSISLATLSDLDAHGIRLKASSGITYYFDISSKRLLQSLFAAGPQDAEFDAPFAQFLYQRYGLSAADSRLLIWLGTQFSSEAPISEVSPYRVIARSEKTGDSVVLQISDSQYVRVDKEGLFLHDNGTDNILFEADQVDPLDTYKLLAAFREMLRTPLENRWADVLSEVRLRDQERQRIITSLLYYMSPFLHRWRGMQLPVELILGESGSGKSTLCELRLSILTGRPILRNAPQDLKDWHASITSTGGLHVTDNVQLVDKSLRQRLSDEICRIVTEPSPYVEQRKYYTNADLIRMPVRAVFAVTAIQQPFQNADLLQRSMILDLDKSKAGINITFNSEWKNQQLARYGGREAWLAHHLVVLHRFFQAIAKEWNLRYDARHRLIHFEQSIITMAKLFKMPWEWIPEYLNLTSDRIVSENDWALEGIQAFANVLKAQIPAGRVTAKEISEWALAQEDFHGCEMLTNSRRLGRYMQQHKSLVMTFAGLEEDGMIRNRAAYRLYLRTRK
jgi:Domain of unknown function (DUF3854)